jgi:heat shock protein HslJ
MRRVIVLAGVLLALAACGQGRQSGGGAGGSAWPAGRTFLSTAVTEDGKPRPLVAGSRIELTFHDDGRLSARAGCNHLGGPGAVSGDRLTVTDLSMTEMGCDQPLMAQDTWLADVLTGGLGWRLAGDELVLTGDRVELTLIDRRVADPDRPLVGTRWELDSILSGDSVSSVPDGAGEAVLEFAPDGSYQVTSGCVIAAGTAAVRADTITFTPDGAICKKGGAVVEAVAPVLRGAVTYRIEARRLTLNGANGKGLGFRAAS